MPDPTHRAGDAADRRGLHPVALLLAWSSVVVLLWSGFQIWLKEPILTRLHRADPPQPTVLFVVLDTVRADHLSLCGYPRQTSPVLSALVEGGAAHTCRAYAPGSWTFPSHASYFTGMPVTAHGAHFVPEGTDIRQLLIRPLRDDLQTLAEDYAARGYQTVGLSGNPVLQPASGLDQGFATWRVAEGFGPWYGGALEAEVQRALREADPVQPLFLFVNIADAHDPWFPIPEGNGLVPARDDILVYFETDPVTDRILPDGPWQRYVAGAMSPAERDAFLTRLTDHYDWALRGADETLGRVLEQVEAHGWARAGMRLIVVSDHGEFLGEHQLARHGRYLWEPNQRVPLLYWERDATGATTAGPDLDAPMSALEAYDLALHGRRARPHRPVEAVAFPDATWQRISEGRVGKETSAALWHGDEKIVWVDGDITAYDLAEEPGEEIGDEAGASGALEELVERTLRARDRHVEDADPALIEALRAAGYVE